MENPGVTDKSPYSPQDLDFRFDLGDGAVCSYIAVDLRDGRYGVFVIHRESREWWRLVAIFSTWDRAERYAGVENDCAYSREEIDPGKALDVLQQEELIPAPDTLPPEPPSSLESALQAEGSPYAKLWTRDYSQTLPLSNRICEREGCGYFIPMKRAENHNTKYCSAECGEIATKKRALAKKSIVAAPEPAADITPPLEVTLPATEPDATEEPKWTDERVDQLRQLVAEGLSYSEIGTRLGVSKNSALGKASRLGITQSEPKATGPADDKDEIARFIAERGVTKLPPDPRLP